MSTSTLPKPETSPPLPSMEHAPIAEKSPARDESWLQGLASLQLTVWLFALSIFLVLAGTLAQVDRDISQVVDEFFRSFIARIEFQLFFPPSFFPNQPQFEGGFYFPGGWTLGGLLCANLVAAHLVRFRVQAKGKQLAAGWGLIAIGSVVTGLVIISGANADGLQAVPWISWSGVWNLLLVGLAIGSAGSMFAGLRIAEQASLRRALTVTGVLGLLILLWALARGVDARPNDSSLRILWQLGKGTLAGLVLLAGCGLVFRKRAGVVLLHLGIGLLMFNELLVGLTAVEGKMHIAEGQSANYVENIHRLELAVIGRSEPNQDDVVAVPQSLLTGDRLIRHPDLPFDVRVDAFYRNSVFRKADPNAVNPATAGLGVQWMAQETPSVSGTDARGGVNQSAAYVTFLDKQTAETLGTHLVSLQQSALELPEKVSVGDDVYKVALRFQRTYKPYSLHLLDVRKDDYLGTNTPRNYSSDVRLVDESRNVDREVKIWMNNPLRFAGETFYQSGYFRDPQSGMETTTLQVVSNTGWMIPYIACMLVATGMLAHFLITLLRFLRRREQTLSAGDLARTRGPNEGAPRRTFRQTYLVPACIVIVFGGWIMSRARTPQTGDGEFGLYEFGRVPVVYQGRAKPIDTLARNSLRILSDRQTFVDSEGERQPAIRWFLDLFGKPEEAAEHRVFRIEHAEVLQTLGLETRKGLRYSYSELQDRLGDLTKQTELARALDPKRLSVYQKKLLQVSHKIGLYELLVQSFSKPSIRSASDKAMLDLLLAQQQHQLLAERTPPLVVPVSTENDQWTTYAEASLTHIRSNLEQGDQAADPPPALAALDTIRDAYRSGEAERFNDAVQAYLTSVPVHVPAGIDPGKIDFEAFFNHFAPFYLAAVLYLIAFILTALSWLGYSRPLNRAALSLVLLTFVVHSFALLARIYISGRPPVTNLYSSAVFIGWGCVLLGMVFERMFRMGSGNVISTVAGFSTLLIAHFLAGDGDTFAVLQAVLDTQFWLATHVVCITLGYSTTYVAGLLGILYILRGVLTPTLRTDSAKDFARMIYGTLCFATIFSFVGTVLGGLWADDSWGRFWGWDPKENGALIIVLWNALVLHARWGGLVRERGLAVLAVAGNIAVSWSWFGVNELGVGLHSYGFTEGILLTLGTFVVSQLLVIALGSLPDRWWWSRRSAVTGGTA